MAVVDATPTTFRDSVFAAFDTFWAARTPVAWPNDQFDPESLPLADDTAWARLSLLGSAEPETNHGSGIFRRTGTVTVEIYVRARTATDKLYELSDAALEFIERAAGSSVKDGFLRGGRLVEIGPDGTWYQANVVGDYLYFTERALPAP